MIKKTIILTLIVFLPLVLAGSGLVQAQSGLQVLASSAEAEFPAKLLFKLSATSNVNITDIRLHYVVDRESYAQVTSEVFIEFLPSPAVSVQWAWDMRKTGGLPAGSGVDYWWTVKDANGSEIKTSPLRVSFDDNRYRWQSLTKDKVTIYWYQGERSFAEEVMLATQQALARLTEDTGAYLKKPVRIYIYASAQDLQGAMIFPQEWTGGVTFSRYGIVAIGIAPDNLAWGERAIIHELTHLVVHQMTFNPYIELPTWLNEGLAMYSEGTLEAGYADYLKKAVAENSLISVPSLSSPFSAYGEAASLSYAQSYSLVEFLLANYGQDKMFELLNVFSQGGSYNGALEKVYGFDMAGLDALWREYAAKQYHKTKATTGAVLPPLSVVLANLANGLLSGLRLPAQSGVGGFAW